MTPATWGLRNWLGIASAVLLAAIAVVHGLGVTAIAGALDHALSPFLRGALQAVWLSFSVTAIALATIFLVGAIRGGSVPRWVLVVCALVPATCALLVYAYAGAFFGAHLMLAAGVLGLAAAVLPDSPGNARSTGAVPAAPPRPEDRA